MRRLNEIKQMHYTHPTKIENEARGQLFND